jgi:hypothetical protein
LISPARIEATSSDVLAAEYSLVVAAECLAFKEENNRFCVAIVGGRLPLTILAGEDDGVNPLVHRNSKLAIVRTIITFRTTGEVDAMVTMKCFGSKILEAAIRGVVKQTKAERTAIAVSLFLLSESILILE